MVNLTMSGQYFSLETVISGMYAIFPIRMILYPNSTLDVRMDFSLPEWSLDYKYRETMISMIMGVLLPVSASSHSRPYIYIYRPKLSKHKTFVKHLYNVGPTSKTSG